jgi:muramoyltetrapeptide carboxypeptidase
MIAIPARETRRGQNSAYRPARGPFLGSRFQAPNSRERETRLQALTALKPRRLKPGATIGIAAVSGPVDEAKLDRGLAYLRSKGYGFVEASNLRKRSGFLAGGDRERADGYRALLRFSKVDAIFFARGGYGASRVLEHLDAGEISENPKIHLGGSDLTALFAFLWRHARLAAFYGPMVALEMAAAGQELDWEDVLRGGIPEMYRFAPGDVLAHGSAEGVLLGGCLSLLASLCGTPEAIRGRGAILFWEDTGEDTYRLDRLLTQLERSGTFEGLRGMVIGSVAPRQGAESPETIRDWLRERFRGASFPVAMGLPAGHLERPRTIPLGTRARLDLHKSKIRNPESKISALSFLGPAVR